MLLATLRSCRHRYRVAWPLTEGGSAGCYLQSAQFGSALKSLKDNNPSGAGVEDLALQFKEDPFSAAQSVVEVLTPAQRVVLAAALREQSKPEHLNDAYVDELYSSASKEGAITRGKFRDIILAHSTLNDNKSASAPSNRALWMLFMASAIPFIAFGFLDNFIMLTVGEEIDEVFGARLGLSTLASAGLGNCVADVIGVTAAKAIEQGVKRMPFIKDPKLSRAQNTLPAVKFSKAFGSTAGVMLGCFLGLVPLAIAGNFFIPHGGA